LGVRDAAKANPFNPAIFKPALSLAMQMYLGIKPSPPRIDRVDSSLRPYANRLARGIRDHSFHFKLASRRFAEKIVTRQCVQARLADSAMWLHAWACTLSKLDREIRARKSQNSAALHFMEMADQEIANCFYQLDRNTDNSMQHAAQSAMQHCDKLPNSDYVIHEASPNAKGTGKPPARTGIRQFPGDNAAKETERI
ncbi:MAG TPA: hypothetical protein VHS31_18295, partial [Tepidisphaeraceae bacterium]|nr:hypothetical protein [Tepidisphaeraceae bacterium]